MGKAVFREKRWSENLKDKMCFQIYRKKKQKPLQLLLFVLGKSHLLSMAPILLPAFPLTDSFNNEIIENIKTKLFK